MVWNASHRDAGSETQIPLRRQSSRTRSVRLHSACTVARSVTNPKELTLTNFSWRVHCALANNQARGVSRTAVQGNHKVAKQVENTKFMLTNTSYVT